MKVKTLLFAPVFLGLLMLSCSTQKKEDPAMTSLEARIRRFAPTEISGDTLRLSAGDRGALRKLVIAARYMDSLYRRQVWSGNEALLKRLKADTSTLGALRLAYFQINQGPWSTLDHNAPFLEGVPDPRPLNANYYPDDMSTVEFQSWLSGLAEPEQKKATGFFTTIRRDAQAKLYAVPYNEEYANLLHPAATLLREAAMLTDNVSLRTFLSKRADAFLSNDYYESDVAWMDLDSPIEVTIGPYEVYMDGLFNYKAAFEAFVTLRNDAETAKLKKYSSLLQEIENHLPIEARYRNPSLGSMAPIRVVDEVAVGGEARAGVQTAAFNLPNDEKITAEKGSKRVMLKNVQEAKFQKILTPIAALILDPAQQSSIGFEAFFAHILAHELMHGLGPHTIMLNGKTTTVRQAMKELGSALEEAKADISGLFALQYLIDRGVVEKSAEEHMYTTYLAGVFRSVRFGINEAHGKGMALQFNYLTDVGAFVYDSAAGTFRVDETRIKGAVRDLTGMIMSLQAQGDYEGAKELFNRYAVLRPPMVHALERMKDIPVDIVPRFSQAE